MNEPLPSVRPFGTAASGQLHKNRAVRFSFLFPPFSDLIGLSLRPFGLSIPPTFDMEPFPPIDPPFNAFLGPQVEIGLRRANTVSPGNIKRNLELKAARERNATGPRAKEPEGKLQRSQTHRPLVARPPGRKVGHFTVRSVGQNGKIFLRYTNQCQCLMPYHICAAC